MSEADTVDAVRNSAEYKAAAAQLRDREWRLDNLYWIKNKEGVPIPFKRNFAQRLYSKNEWYRDTILKSRKLGFSTFIAIEILDASIFGSNTVSGIIDRTVDDAKGKLGIVKFAYDRMPKSLREGCPLIVDNQEELKWINGSKIVAGTSYRGDTPQNLHVSEFGPISAKSPDVAKEIKVGSIPSVPQTGKIWVESTAMGTAGQFYDLVKAGEQLKVSGQKLTPLDFRLHFFGWYMDPDNRLPVALVLIPDDMRAYFAELETKWGIKTDGQQQAWYVKTREFLGPDDMRSEHPSTPDECFFASLEGAYFKAEMNLARRERRIGLPIPHDPTRPVHTFWDIGMDDETAIGFMQTDGVRHRFIDFVRQSHVGVTGAVRALREKALERGFQYGKHYGPHDMENTDWSNPNVETRKQVLAGFGVSITTVPRVGDKADSIESARRMINMSYFCADHAGGLVECLDNYSKKWNKSTSQWLAEPAKNGFDHGADAYQQIAMGLEPEDGPTNRGRREKKKGSFWSN